MLKENEETAKFLFCSFLASIEKTAHSFAPEALFINEELFDTISSSTNEDEAFAPDDSNIDPPLVTFKKMHAFLSVHSFKRGTKRFSSFFVFLFFFSLS